MKNLINKRVELQNNIWQLFLFEVSCISYLAGGLDPLPDAEVHNSEDEQQTEG